MRLPHQLMVHRDLFHDFRSVHLRLQDILLHALADLIMRRRILDQLVKYELVLAQDAERLLQIGQLEKSALTASAMVVFVKLQARLAWCQRRARLPSRALAVSRIGQLLRRPDTDVGKIAIGVSRERLRTAYTSW